MMILPFFIKKTIIIELIKHLKKMKKIIYLYILLLFTIVSVQAQSIEHCTVFSDVLVSRKIGDGWSEPAKSDYIARIMSLKDNYYALGFYTKENIQRYLLKFTFEDAFDDGIVYRVRTVNDVDYPVGSTIKSVVKISSASKGEYNRITIIQSLKSESGEFVVGKITLSGAILEK